MQLQRKNHGISLIETGFREISVGGIWREISWPTQFQPNKGKAITEAAQQETNQAEGEGEKRKRKKKYKKGKNLFLLSFKLKVILDKNKGGQLEKDQPQQFQFH